MSGMRNGGENQHNPGRYVLSFAVVSVSFSLVAEVVTAFSYGALASWIIAVTIFPVVFYGFVAGLAMGIVSLPFTRISKNPRVARAAVVSVAWTAAAGSYWLIWSSIWEPGPPSWAMIVAGISMGAAARCLLTRT